MRSSFNGERCAGFSGFCQLLFTFYSQVFEKNQAIQQVDKRQPIYHKKSNKKIKYETFYWSKACQKAFKDLK